MIANRQRVLWALIGICLAACAAGMVVAVVVSAVTATQIREAQVNAVRTIDNTSQTLALVRDCTDPKGECYKRTQERTAEAVDNIGLLSAFAAACADKPNTQTADEIQACVLDLLDRPRTKR